MDKSLFSSNRSTVCKKLAIQFDSFEQQKGRVVCTKIVNGMFYRKQNAEWGECLPTHCRKQNLQIICER